MLSVLAKIANQLEADGHPDLADEVDEIITSLASREPFPRYQPGEMWKEEMEGAEPDQQEELEASSLEPHEQSELGGDDRTYTAFLQDHEAAFARFLQADEAVLHGDSGEGVVDALVDKLEHAIELWCRKNGAQLELDPAFTEEASQLVLRVLNRPQA